MFEKIIYYYLTLVDIPNIFNIYNKPYVEQNVRTYTFFELTDVENYSDEYLNKQLFFLVHLNDPEFVYNYDEYLLTILNEIEYRKIINS
ncbi:MAG TPA: hypothetical protein VI911_08995 [Patescibacteria group bacterium]|nr:MAG: hypothetical protein UR43_C0005G0033 [candidate division TM6 bacterium GW2011_GWF2_33_332]HLD91134.1 hypothetical protein [Patescibacteria group bacterium]